MSEPVVTEADRETAMRITGWWPLIYESFAGAAVAGGNLDDINALETVDVIAAALAAERAKARAPFLALVEFYDRHEYSTLNVDDLRELLNEETA